MRASRERLVAAADAERRRIERELHDGPQQHLIGLAVNLQLARRLADTDLPGLTLLLQEMRGAVQEALDEIRRLGSRIHPPVLADCGLVEALRAAATEATVPTRVETAQTHGRFSPEIEAAVYFCCVEALDALHGAERATIELSEGPDTLVFAVTAHGTGPDPWDEQDLLAIGDRLAAAGGQLAGTTAPAGGACVSGTIPLGP